MAVLRPRKEAKPQTSKVPPSRAATRTKSVSASGAVKKGTTTPPKRIAAMRSQKKPTKAPKKGIEDDAAPTITQIEVKPKSPSKTSKSPAQVSAPAMASRRSSTRLRAASEEQQHAKTKTLEPKRPSRKAASKPLLPATQAPTDLESSTELTWALDLFTGIMRFQGHIPASTKGWRKFFDPSTCHLHDQSLLVYNIVRLLDDVLFSLVNSYVLHCRQPYPFVELSRTDVLKAVHSWPKDMIVDLMTQYVDFHRSFDFLFGAWNDKFVRSVPVDTSKYAPENLDLRSPEQTVIFRNEFVWCVQMSRSPLHFHLPGSWDLSRAEVASLGELGLKLVGFHGVHEYDSQVRLTLQDLKLVERVWYLVEHPGQSWLPLTASVEATIASQDGDHEPWIAFEPKPLSPLTKTQQRLAKKRHEDMDQVRRLAAANPLELPRTGPVGPGTLGERLKEPNSILSPELTIPSPSGPASSRKEPPRNIDLALLSHNEIELTEPSKSRRANTKKRRVAFHLGKDESDVLGEHETVEGTSHGSRNKMPRKAKRKAEEQASKVEEDGAPRSLANTPTDDGSSSGWGSDAEATQRRENFRKKLEGIAKRDGKLLTENLIQRVRDELSQQYEFDGDFVIQKGASKRNPDAVSESPASHKSASSFGPTTPNGFPRTYKRPFVESDPGEPHLKPRKRRQTSRSAQAGAATSEEWLHEPAHAKKPDVVYLDVLGLETASANAQKPDLKESGKLTPTAVYNTTIACHQLLAKLLNRTWSNLAVENKEFVDLVKSGHRGDPLPLRRLSFGSHDVVSRSYATLSFRPLNTEEFTLLEDLAERDIQPLTEPGDSLLTRFIMFRICKVVRIMRETTTQASRPMPWVNTDQLCAMVNNTNTVDAVRFGIRAYLSPAMVVPIAWRLAMLGQLAWRPSSVAFHGQWSCSERPFPERLLAWDTEGISQEYKQSEALAAPTPVNPTWLNIWPQHVIEYPQKVERQISLTKNFFLCLAYRLGHLIRCLEEETVACLHDELRDIDPGAGTADQPKTIEHWGQFQRITRRVLDRRQKMLGMQMLEGPDKDANFEALCLLEDQWPQDLCAIWPPEIRESWKVADAELASWELEEIELARLTHVPVHSDPLRNQAILDALATLTTTASFDSTTAD